MTWQWHQLDHKQINCTLLEAQPCQHLITQFFRGQMLFLKPNQQCQSQCQNSNKTIKQLQQHSLLSLLTTNIIPDIRLGFATTLVSHLSCGRSKAVDKADDDGGGWDRDPGSCSAAGSCRTDSESPSIGTVWITMRLLARAPRGAPPRAIGNHWCPCPGCCKHNVPPADNQCLIIFTNRQTSGLFSRTTWVIRHQ